MITFAAITSLLAALVADEEEDFEPEEWSELQAAIEGLGTVYPEEIDFDFHLVVSPMSWSELRPRLLPSEWITWETENFWRTCPLTPGERVLFITSDGHHAFLRAEGWSIECERSAVPRIAPTLPEAAAHVLEKWKAELDDTWTVIDEESLDDKRLTYLLAHRPPNTSR
jgi:hypothetical protein